MQLLRHERDYDGSYRQSFDQYNGEMNSNKKHTSNAKSSTVPIIVPGSNGAQQFNGYWVRLDLKPQPYQQYQTDVQWNTWSCLTGNPFRECFLLFFVPAMLRHAE